MLNVERIRTMARLSRYEHGSDREYLNVNHMYRSDYIGMALLKNFTCITIGYVLILAFGGLYHFDFLTNNWFRLDLTAVLTKIIGIYAALVAGYSVYVYVTCSIKYEKMKKIVQNYAQELQHLEEQYGDINSKDETDNEEWRETE